MKTYQVSNHEPGTLTIKKIATVEAEYYKIGDSGELEFFDREFICDVVNPENGYFVSHTAFASGQWARVEEVKERLGHE